MQPSSLRPHVIEAVYLREGVIQSLSGRTNNFGDETGSHNFSNCTNKETRHPIRYETDNPILQIVRQTGFKELDSALRNQICQNKHRYKNKEGLLLFADSQTWTLAFCIKFNHNTFSGVSFHLAFEIHALNCVLNIFNLILSMTPWLSCKIQFKLIVQR